VFGSINIDYKLFLNLLGVAVFGSLIFLTKRRGERDPVCGMQVDRKKAYVSEHDGRTVYSCSEHCQATFNSDPAAYVGQLKDPPQG